MPETYKPMRVSTEPVFGVLMSIDPDPEDGAVVIRAAAGLVVELLDNGNLRITAPIGAPGQWLVATPEATITAQQANGDVWVSYNWYDMQFIARARELEASL